MNVAARITTRWNKSVSYSQVTISKVEAYAVDSALDTDTDAWAIDIGDPGGKLISLFDPDSEVRVDLIGHPKNDDITYLQTGFADTIVIDQTGLLSLQGRDVSAAAVDSIAPPTRWQNARANQIIKTQGQPLGFRDFALDILKPFKNIYTDGSESYWEFWYRMYRKRDRWLWTTADGILTGHDLNYNQDPPLYYFGTPTPGTSKNRWIPVETIEVRKNTQTRVGEVWVLGQGSSIDSFVAKVQDKTMKDWIKKPLRIIKEQKNSPSTQKEGRKEALETIFEGKVGELEITLTVPDAGKVIQQNNMAEVNIPQISLHDIFFVVGSQPRGGADGGFGQTIRLRQKGYAISRIVPPDPTTQPSATTLPTGVNVTIPRQDLLPVFMQAAKEFRGIFPYDMYLAMLLAICEQETGFRNEPNNSHTEWYAPPTQGNYGGPASTPSDALTAWMRIFANDPSDSLNPDYPNERAVGYMQLLSPEPKHKADSWGGKVDSSGLSDEFIGGRWSANGNILAGAWWLQQKAANQPGTLQGLLAAVASYGEGAAYAQQVYERYKRYIIEIQVDTGDPGLGTPGQGNGPYGVLAGDGLTFAGPDQGIDFTGRGPLYAPAGGVITDVHIAHFIENFSGPWIVLQIGGYQMSNHIYFSESIQVAGGIRPGVRVVKGTPIAYVEGGYGCEVGWARSNGLPLANLDPGNPRKPTAAGLNFQKWILAGGGN